MVNDWLIKLLIGIVIAFAFLFPIKVIMNKIRLELNWFGEEGLL